MKLKHLLIVAMISVPVAVSTQVRTDLNYRVHFDPDKHQLDQNALSVLNNVLAELKTCSYCEIRI